MVAHALTAKPLAGRYAEYAASAGRPADSRPTPETSTRSRLGQRHEVTAADNDPEGDTSTGTIDART